MCSYFANLRILHSAQKNECNLPLGWELAKWLERLKTNAEVATVLGSIPASSDTVEPMGRQFRQYWIKYKNIGFNI